MSLRLRIGRSADAILYFSPASIVDTQAIDDHRGLAVQAKLVWSIRTDKNHRTHETLGEFLDRLLDKNGGKIDKTEHEQLELMSVPC